MSKNLLSELRRFMKAAVALVFVSGCYVWYTHMIGKKEVLPTPIDDKEVLPTPIDDKEVLPTPIDDKEVLPTPGDCCTESIDITIETILKKSENCSKKIELLSAQCDCGSLIACKFVIVSGISDNHFEEANNFIASVQTHMPNTSLIIYNLGLREQNMKTLRSYCNIQVRQFNFSKYPTHVKFLFNYAWKPLIINEIYHKFAGKAILWADSSCRLLQPLHPLFHRFSKFPIIGATTYHHNFISSTHDSMKKYLQLNKTRKEYATVGDIIQAGIILYWLNEFLQERFLKFWVDCALHKECIAPEGANLFGCNWKGTYTTGKYTCHRYDQAAFNAILTREFGITFMRKFINSTAESYLVVDRQKIKRSKVLTKGQCGHEG